MLQKTQVNQDLIDYCYSGEEALQKLKTSQETYKFILIDFNMPVLSGPETTRRIRDLFGGRAQPKIVGLTAHTQKEELDKGVRAGMDYTLTKPLNYKDLISLLE